MSLFGGLAAGLGLGALNFISSRFKSREDRNLASWSARQQDAYSWNHWNAMNAYNHPKEQMKRLREAGLNPLLVYGNGSVTGNTASGGTVPNVATPESSMDFGGSMLNGIMAYQDLAAKDTQMQLNDAQRDYTLARAEKVRQDMANSILDRQSPARSAVTKSNGFWNSVKDFSKTFSAVTGGVGTGILGAKKLKNAIYGNERYRPVNSNIGRTSTSPGLFSRIGSRVGSWLGKLGKASWFYNLIKPQPLAPF